MGVILCWFESSPGHITTKADSVSYETECLAANEQGQSPPCFAPSAEVINPICQTTEIQSNLLFGFLFGPNEEFPSCGIR